MTKIEVIAVDFDGTLCVNAFPEIGAPNTNVIYTVKKLQAQGVKFILWTCRSGDRLEEAVKWCKSQGLIFDAINENLPEMIEKFGTDPRKLGADLYLDDKAITPTRFCYAEW